MTPFLRAAIVAMLPGADPEQGCSECTFDWSASSHEALAVITDAPAQFGSSLAGGPLPSPPADGGWTASAYVWHTADVTRAWAERLHSLRHDPAAEWAGFDPDELAAARHYDALPPVSAPWALELAVGALTGVVDGLDHDTGFEHPEWGDGTVADALRWVAHEALHHQLDVRRRTQG